MFVIHSSTAENEEREPLFSIDGREYTIPVKVGGEVMLQAMEKARTEPDGAVTAWCVEQLLGREGWAALRGVKGLDPAIVQGVMEVCRNKVFGTLEREGKG